jgi:glycosyltransferase involved in cell wall biosynthesis
MRLSLHVSTALGFRGGENQVLLLVEGLRKRGEDARIVAPPKSALLARADEAGLPTIFLPSRRTWNPLAPFRLSLLLRRLKPDILHLHDGHAAALGKTAAFFFDQFQQPKGTPRLYVVAHRRTVFPLRTPNRYAGRIDAIVAISRAAGASLTEAGVPAQRIATVHSGLNFDRAAVSCGVALRKQWGIPEHAFVVAHAAALTAEKRQRDLIATAAGVKAAETAKDRPVYWLVAGEGPLESNLRAAAAHAGVSERVLFVGFLRNLSPLWAAAQATAFFSEREGLCTALVEAQGAGLPAISTRCGGPEEVVADEETGYLFPIGDNSTAAKIILRLSGDLELRRRLGTAAAERMRRLFSAEAMTEGVLRVYDQAKTKT